MAYKTIAVRSDDYERLDAVKRNFEADFKRTTTWGEFLIILATGYIMGRQIMQNEDTFRLSLEEESSPAGTQD